MKRHGGEQQSAWGRRGWLLVAAYQLEVRSAVHIRQSHIASITNPYLSRMHLSVSMRAVHAR